MAESGWYPDPTGRSAQRWHDGNRWTDDIIGKDGVQGTDAFEPVAPIAPQATPASASEPRRLGVSPVAVIVVAIGALLAGAGLLVLDWADGGVTFGDIRDAGAALDVGAVVEWYVDWAGFVAFVLAVLMAGAAAAIPSGPGVRAALNFVGAGAAGGAAVYHALAVSELFPDSVDPAFGAWAPAVGYVLMIVGLVLGPFTARRSGGAQRAPASIAAGAVGVVTIIGMIGAFALADSGGGSTAEIPIAVPDGSGGNASPTADPAGPTGGERNGGPDDQTFDGFMSTLDGDNVSEAPGAAIDSPAAQLGSFLDSAAGNDGTRTVRRDGATIEVCGAGLGSTCLVLSNFVLDESGYAIADMDVNGQRLSTRLRFDDTAVPDLNPNGVISISAQGQFAVPNGPTIVVLVLKQYDERVPEANGCDGATATLSTAGPATTHQGGGLDRGSFLGNTMTLNFPTAPSVGGTLDLDCYTADGALEHHRLTLPG